MTSIEEAKELRKRIITSLSYMESGGGFSQSIKESEIKFRYESIVGMLIIAKSDLFQLISYWEKEI